MSQWTDKWDLKQAGLGNKLLSHRRRKQFMSVKTSAERGMGKSMYNLTSIAYAYYHLGYTETESWKKALDCFIFTPDQLIRHVRHALANDYIIDFLCIDDATVHFNNRLWFINLYTSTLIEATFDTLREAVRCLLINCPNTKRLMGALQSYDDYAVTIYNDEGSENYLRKAVCIKWFSLPSGTRKYHKNFEDRFSCYVPNWVYTLYRPMRRKYLEDVTAKLDELRDKHDKKKMIDSTSVSN